MSTPVPSTPSSIILAPAVPADVPALAALLSAAGLPDRDFEPHLATFQVWREGREIRGAVGLEVHGPDALLRSLVVSPGQRGRGAGRILVAAAVELARSRGVRRLFLLTTTAAGFFARLGFTPCARGEVPPAIAATAEFTELCPASSACLTAAIAHVSA